MFQEVAGIEIFKMSMDIVSEISRCVSNCLFTRIGTHIWNVQILSGCRSGVHVVSRNKPGQSCQSINERNLENQWAFFKIKEFAGEHSCLFPHHPLLRQVFALAPIHPRSECSKPPHTKMLVMQAKVEENKTHTTMMAPSKRIYTLTIETNEFDVPLFSLCRVKKTLVKVWMQL